MGDSGYPASSLGSCGSQGTLSSMIFPGKLKKVLLKNFMCHDHFEIEFNPCVNFIHGRNGSGKSAIATAIVLGFGQRATATNRGVAVKCFIKRGRRMATIEITLHNRGTGNKYKHEDYGDEITVIRRIVENGGSQYRIKGESGAEENLSRHDLDSLLLHFNIQPQNPLCILSQDTARSFFKSRDPKQMFQLFVLGTRLEMLSERYQSNIQHMMRLKKECESNQEALKKMYQDVIEANKKKGIAMKLKQVLDKKKNLENEIAWARVDLWEKKLVEHTNDLEKAVKESEDFQNNQGNQNVGQKALLDKKAELENDLVEIHGESESLDIEIKSNRENIHRIQDQLRNKNQTLEKHTTMICSVDENIAVLEDGIRKVQSMHSKSQEYNQKITDVLQKIQETDATIKTTETYSRQLGDTYQELNSELESINNNANNADYKFKDLELKLTQLKEGNSLGVYGHWMPTLVKRVTEAYERGMFRQQPRGPLGAYIKVNDEAWVPAIESTLRPVLNLFCVSCQEDSKVLNRLFDEVIDRNRGGARPGIIITKFIFRVHDFQQYEVKTNRYRSLISSIKVSDAIVTNCLIDQLAIEQILLVPEVSEALRLMETKQNAPLHCKFTLTPKADVIYPAPHYRFYAGNVNRRAELLQTDVTRQIKEVENKLHEVTRERAQLHEYKVKLLREIRKVQLDLQQQKNELSKLFAKKRNFEHEKLELEKNYQFEPASIEVYQSEIQELTGRKQFILKEIEAIKKEKEELKGKIHENNKKHNELSVKQKEINQRINDSKLEIGAIEKELREWYRKKDEYERRLDENNKHIDKLKLLVSEAEKKKQYLKRIIETENIEQVQVTRDPETIKKEINQLAASIKVFEQELGGSQEFVYENHRCKERMYQSKKSDIAQLQNCIEKNKNLLQSEKASYQKNKSWLTRYSAMTFRSLLKVRNLDGKLDFDFDEKKLQITVLPNVKGSSTENVTTLNSLSGGERSYATTAFIRALWNCMNSPFYILDEFDVFTDLSNRTQIIQLLIDHAKSKLDCQFLFITPLDLSYIITNDMITVHVIHNPRDDEEDN